jgi:hypothetical protein
MKWLDAAIENVRPGNARIDVRVSPSVPLGIPWDGVITLMLSEPGAAKCSKIIVPVSGVFVHD